MSDRIKQQQPVYRMPTHAVVQAIDEWMAKGKSYYWSGDPDTVKAGIISTDDDGFVLYSNCIAILRDAATSKLIGNANAGMAWIEQQWRQLRVRI